MLHLALSRPSLLSLSPDEVGQRRPCEERSLAPRHRQYSPDQWHSSRAGGQLVGPPLSPCHGHTHRSGPFPNLHSSMGICDMKTTHLKGIHMCSNWNNSYTQQYYIVNHIMFHGMLSIVDEHETVRTFIDTLSRATGDYWGVRTVATHMCPRPT